MGKKKLGNISWEIEFKIDTERERDIWEILHRFDKEKPEALCEWAVDDMYVWHGFLSRKSLNDAIPLVFDAFEEVTEVRIYKDTTVGCIVTPVLRETITR